MTPRHAEPGFLDKCPDDPVGLYIDLMKRCLTNWIYIDTEPTSDGKTGWKKLNQRILSRVDRLSGSHFVLRRPKNLGVKTRVNGRDWPPTAHTMIGLKRLDNLQFCVEEALRNNIPGDLIETGVWRGGACIFMRAILKAYGVTDRRVWVADSFAGLPAGKPEEYPADTKSQLHRYEALAISLETVQSNFRKYGLLDDQVRFLQGWFHESLPKAPIERLAVARLDGDMYESTLVALDALYHKLSPGGFVIIDDYGAVPGCRKAVHDFRDKHGISDKIEMIDGIGAFWQRAFKKTSRG